MRKLEKNLTNSFDYLQSRQVNVQFY